MQNTPRPWTPTAPSLLWAHEIRRENIHLLNQLSTTQSDLASTTTALASLQQTVSSLETVVRERRAREDYHNNVSEDLGRRVVELEGGVGARLAETEGVLEMVRGENERVDKRLMEVDGVLEIVRGESGRVGERLDELGRVVGDRGDGVRGEVEGLVREVVAREMEGLRLTLRGQCDGCRVGRGLPDEGFKDTDIVPDSMTRERRVLSSGRDNDTSLQTLSQTTLGSSNFGDVGDGPDPDEAEYSMIKQDGRSLSEYFSLAEAGRGRLPPRKREGRIVEAFVTGLDDAGVSVCLERLLDEEGWMWGVLAAAVQRIVREREALSRQTDQSGHGKHKSRKRRCIPIVPVDEEDLLYN